MVLHCSGLSSSILRQLQPAAPSLQRSQVFPARRQAGTADHQKSQFRQVSASASAAACTTPATKSAACTGVDYDQSRVLDQARVNDWALEQEEEAFVEAQLRLLVSAASDRAQMHAILAQQRDNWNKLFQNTLTLGCFTACVLAALSARTSAISPSLSIPALLLNSGCAAIMSVVNCFQPSQLAEEQRSAVRQFKRLASDVEYGLQVAPCLRQHMVALLRHSQRRLQALDAAFPMPLTPGGLEKFPSKVTPPALLSLDGPQCSGDTGRVPSGHLLAHGAINGWDECRSKDLQRLAEQVRHSDINMYVSWAENVIKVNKCLAIAAPLLAACAATLNGVALLSSAGAAPWAGALAAVCSVLAAFTGSVSHDLQLGMGFEMYRNAAGHYGEVEESVLNTLREPIEERENGVLFQHRVAYKLGRWTGDLQSS